MSGRFFCCLCGIVLCAVLAPAAGGGGFGAALAAQGPVTETEYATSWLAVARDAVMPGEQLHVAFSQKLEAGWHVYWRNPGDSGLPLKLDFKKPDGVIAGDIIYPVPHALPVAPLMNYGHEGAPVFLAPVTIPASATPGEVLTFEVDAQWLICADICVPEGATLSLEVPVTAAPGAVDAVWQPRIETALEEAPMPLRTADGGGVEAISHDIDGTPVVFIAATDLFGTPVASEALQAKIDNGDYYFFPYTEGVVEPAAPQLFSAVEGGILIEFAAGFDYDPEAGLSLDGVLVDRSQEPHRGGIIRAPGGTLPRGIARSATAPMAGTEKHPASSGAVQAGPAHSRAVQAGPAHSGAVQAGKAGGLQTLPMILLFSLTGGLILNIMPCVFPVIFMKAAGLAALGPDAKSEVRLHGIVYTFGVVVCFSSLAAVLIFLKAGGEEVGWGFHLQSPIMVSFFTLVVFLIGLNFAGLFEVGTSVQGAGSGLAAKQGVGGAFFTGLLAVAVAAPCIGPFLGVPIGYAFTQSAAVTVLIFGVMGIGLALPYLMLSLFPQLAGVLPRPGAWMVRFRELLSFAMFATCIWLIWTVTLQAGPPGLVQLLSALLVAGFGAWLFGLSQDGSGGPVRKLLALIMIGIAVYGINQIRQAPPANAAFQSDTVVAFSEAKLSELRAQGRGVFVDFTAAWCVTCQVNKRVVLSTKPVKEAFAANDVVLMIADWTVQDPAITRALEAMGRSGVPLYLYYAPDAQEPEILPQILTVPMVVEAVSG